MLDVGLVLLEICPLAPPGVQKYADQLTGYVLCLVRARPLARDRVRVGR